MLHGTVSVHPTTVSQILMLDDSNNEPKLNKGSCKVLNLFACAFYLCAMLMHGDRGSVWSAVCLGSVMVPGGTEIDLMLDVSFLY
jgi:hypothetical protein